MRIAVSVAVLAAVASAATTSPTKSPTPVPDVVCDTLNIVTDASGKNVVCGDGFSTNCNNYKVGTVGAVCAAEPAGQRVCCKGSQVDTAALAEIDSCTDCLKPNADSKVIHRTWDGSHCFGINLVGLPIPVLPQEAMVTDRADCPADCQKLGFTGTCWRRCGTRGWGVDEAQYYLLQQSKTPYNPYFGVPQQVQVLPAGQVPSAFGVTCPDPSIIAAAAALKIPSVPTIYNPFVAPTNTAASTPYYGAYAPSTGAPIYGGLSSSMYNGANGYFSGLPSTGYFPQYVSTGRQSLTSSVYTSAPLTSTYTPSAISSTLSTVAPSTSAPRCDPATQCSCDKNCCTRGDCCEDVKVMGCAYLA